MMTHFEEKVIRLNKHVPRVDSKVFDWALDEAMPHLAVIRDSETAICLKCGAKMSADCDFGYARCPKCGLRLQVINPSNIRKMKLHYEYLFRMECGMADLRLIRTFRMGITLNLLTGVESYHVKELSRHWISQNGNEAYIGSTLCLGRFVFPDILRLRHRNIELYNYFEGIAHPYPGVGHHVDLNEPDVVRAFSDSHYARAE